MAAQEIITGKNISPAFLRSRNAMGWVDVRADEIKEELEQGESKPFQEVISHIGNPQTFGQPPITSLRQFLSCLLCPKFLDDPSFPKDLREKARRILNATPGFSIGCYTNPCGMKVIREDVAQYISRRDGHTADPEEVFLMSGANNGIKFGLAALSSGCFCTDKDRAGLMIPSPGFYHYSARSEEFNLYQIPYLLDEDDNWALNISELKRALDEARPYCKPRGLVMINPGNPTGQVLTYENIRDVIKFCAREKLVLFADEVYQQTVFTEDVQFHSCRKVLRDLGPDYNKFQLMSINSVSKGFHGECGLRGAYLELVGFSKEVIGHYKNLLSSPYICPSTTGQAAVSAVCNPPRPGDESYETFLKEKTAILESYRRRAKKTTSVLNSLEGVTCNEVTGSLFAFPRIKFPQKVIEVAKVNNCTPDEFYCWQMLEATGIAPVPGSSFGQKEGTHHFRLTILPSEDKIIPMFNKISQFHKEFMDKYRDDSGKKK